VSGVQAGAEPSGGSTRVQAPGWSEDRGRDGDPVPAGGTGTAGTRGTASAVPVERAARGVPQRGRPLAGRARTRRAHLRLTRLDPWSVMKIAFMLAIAVAVVEVVAVVVLWSSLNAAHVFTQINTIARNPSYFGKGGSTFDVLNYIGLNRVLGVTILLAVVNAVLTTAIATLGAFLYNLSSGLLGGIEVTLAETD
jgi:hypothetical protein